MAKNNKRWIGRIGLKTLFFTSSWSAPKMHKTDKARINVQRNAMIVLFRNIVSLVIALERVVWTYLRTFFFIQKLIIYLKETWTLNFYICLWLYVFAFHLFILLMQRVMKAIFLRNVGKSNRVNSFPFLGQNCEHSGNSLTGTVCSRSCVFPSPVGNCNGLRCCVLVF